MQIYGFIVCVTRNLPRYACLYLFLFFTISRTNELQNFIVTFFKKWDIQHPLNEEFSIKFGCREIHPHRYIICIPRSYIDLSRKEQIEDLFTFIAEKPEVKDRIKKYLLEETTGWVGYAIDFSDPKNLKKKAYFDFGKNSGRGIDSYEWQAGDSRVARRVYTNLNEYEIYLPRLLSNHQIKVFNRMKQYLNFEKTLLKQHKDTHSLCFACKNNVLVSEVKSYLCDLMKGFGSSKKDLEDIFCRIGNYRITWIYIQTEEVTIYYRKKDWIYHA